MAVAMFMHWKELTAEQYDALRRRVNLENDVPHGGKFHVSSFDSDGAHVFDLWDSAEDFERYASERLMPVVQELGIPGQPETRFVPVHAIFAPMFEGARA